MQPKRPEVLTQLVCIDTLWRNIGIGLGVSCNFLQGLAESSQSNLAKLDQIIQKWLDVNGKDDGAPITWITILDLLKGPLINNKALAMKIYQSLKEESSKEQIASSKYTIGSSYCYINVLDSIQLIIR